MDLFLVDLLRDAEDGRCDVPKGPLEAHLRALRPAPGSVVSNRLLEHLRERLKGTDWRAASRAISIASCLHDNVAFPPLIESLSIWLTREATDLPVKRVQGDILGELERRSGRRLGLKPERWRALWQAVRAGELSLEGHVEGRPSFSRAGFFGLHPMTDRVTFVIDRSGSMDEAFGASTRAGSGGGRTRYAEAIAQLVGCLEELGPRTRFNVVLFSDTARIWRKELKPASEPNLRAVALWARALQANGGTNLRAGVETALRLDRRGRLDLAELESDTIIVLCDGETAEGPGWVAPLLARIQPEARVVFHAVQIGGASDGTLQRLCELSGGDHVAVAP